jgi:NADPH:quinone reductase
VSADAIPAVMRAAWYERCGPAHDVLQVGEIETSRPGIGQVLVRVAVSGVNPHDTKKRSGWLGAALPAARIIPHSDGAGTIVAAGPAVPEERLGERVWFFRADAVRPGAGAAADYAVVAADHAVPLPDHIGFEIGACLGVPALTAHRAVFADGPVTGQTLLVTGGAGAVASYAIQLAVWNSARVIATVSSPAKATHALALGAEATVDYRSENVVDAVMALTSGRGVDRIVEVDFGANVETAKAVLRVNGTIASYSSTRVRTPVLPYYDLAFKGVTLHFVQGLQLTPAMRSEALKVVSVLLRQDRLVHPIAATFELTTIANAHIALERGALIGKVLVRQDDRSPPASS